jgi:hypothetical protein
MTTCCSSGTGFARRGLISLCVASVLGATAFVAGDRAGAPPRALDPALLFPAGSVMTLGFDGKSLNEHAKELSISKIWAEPEVQEFFKETLEMVNEQAETAVGGFIKQLGLEDKDVEALGNARIVLGITRFEPPAGGMDSGGVPGFDLMLVADLRGSQKAVESLLKAGEAMLGGGEEGAFKDTTVGGIPAKMMPVPDGGPFTGVTWLFHEGWLIAGTSTTQLEAAVARAKSGDQAGSLASDAAYAASMKEVARPKSVLSFYVNAAPLIGIAMESSPPAERAMMKALGIDGVKSVAYGMDLDGPSVREREFVVIAPGSPIGKLMQPIDAAGLLSKVPKRSVAAYAVSMPVKQAFEWFMSAVKTTPAADEIETGLAKLEKVLGSSWREDLLPNLGPEMAAFAAMPRFGLLPEFGVLIKVGDRTKVEAAIAKMLERPKAKGAVGSLKFLDATINTVDLGALKIDRDLNLRPAYVFVGDYLLLTLTPHNEKSLLVAMNNKDGGLMAQEGFSKAFAKLQAEGPNAGNLGVSYFDLPWLAGLVLDTAIPLAQAAAPAREMEELESQNNVKLDLTKLPSTEAIVKHLGPILAASQAKEGGIYVDIVSPVGVIPASVIAGAIGGALAARQYMSVAAGHEEEPSERGARRRVRGRSSTGASTRPAAEPRDKDEDK